ncbi:hypothetical protein HBE96_15630 [Clostridium sp. P21]|uniref:HNH nuclease domain-containing protein n=1 Tax=Clostridium muellerianum TaxID=2716538 RepID=A0A7Y0EIH0_9CLOT|nr:hypothetical protein [Clostridium muellerianum]NMM64073.1 hypothetical protein [Clostridium muellerianum]
MKKDGSIIDTKIDAADLKAVLDKGTWFAEWNKEFNNYLVQTVFSSNTAGKKHIEKQTLPSFILGTHPKAPIRHVNGDTLDNRRCNISIYDQNNGVNDYESLDQETSAIILRDKYGIKKSKTIIDKEDLDKVINSGYTWVPFKSHSENYAVANTADGRIYLHDFIMNTTDGTITKHINLNTLDNRKANLKNSLLAEPSEANDNEQ